MPENLFEGEINRHPKNWKARERELNNAIKNYRQEYQLLSRRCHELYQSCENGKKNAEETRRRPIIAIMESMGEWTSQMEPLADPKTIVEWSKNLKQWTGVCDMDLLWSEIGGEIPAEPSKKPPVFSQRQQIVIFLTMLRKGFNFTQMSCLLGLGRDQTRNIFKHALVFLKNWTLNEVSLPSLTQWRLTHTEKFIATYGPNSLMFFVDGTVLPCLNSRIGQMKRAFWNFKHMMTAKCFTIVVTEDGRIVLCSKTVPGSIHDRVAWNKSGLLDLLVEKYGLPHDAIQNGLVPPGTTFSIGGDKGYPGILVPKGWNLHITGMVSRKDWPSTLATEYDHEKFYCPGEDTMVMDNHLKTFRAGVECVFSFLKNYHLIMDACFVFWHKDILDDCIRTTCAMYNHNRRYHPDLAE
jgi:hypothetical protein